MSDYSHKYYLEHRDKIIAQTKAYQADHPEVYRKQSLAYYYAHREERLAYYRAHREDRREERIAYGKAHRDSHRVIKHNGKVILRNVNKPPKPMLCTLCGRKSYLTYHHWEDRKPDIGLWICNGCHAAIHRMIKVGVLKANVKSQLIVRSALGTKKSPS